MREDISWECYFINIAHNVKLKSPDPKIKRGSVLVTDDNCIASAGFNSLPKDDNNIIDWENREFVNFFILQPEIYCIINSNPTVDLSTSIFYSTHSPIASTIKIIASAGIKKIIYDICSHDISLTKEICKFFMIELVKYRPKNKILIGSNSL